MKIASTRSMIGIHMSNTRNQKYKRCIGIVGGVGPLASADFFAKILQLAQNDSDIPAKKDQDFPRIIMDCNSQIPDRTNALLYGGESPVDELVETAQNLVRAGAQLIVIPCNTAHAFLREVQEKVQIPIINMIEEVGDEIRRLFPKYRKIGIMATTGTVKSRIYDNAFIKRGLTPLYLEEDLQEKYVMEAIYGCEGIKAGHLELPRKLLSSAAHLLEKRGAEAIIMACTEIPLALEKTNVPLIDSNIVLAKSVLRQAILPGP